MDPRDFYKLAKELSQSNEPAKIRSAISRAYYGIYNTACELLEKLGFKIPQGPQGHANVQHRLNNSQDQGLIDVGVKLADLHNKRLKADYHRWLKERDVENPKTAQAIVQQTEQMIRELDSCLSDLQRCSQVQAAIQQYDSSIAPLS